MPQFVVTVLWIVAGSALWYFAAEPLSPIGEIMVIAGFVFLFSDAVKKLGKRKLSGNQK